MICTVLEQSQDPRLGDLLLKLLLVEARASREHGDLRWHCKQSGDVCSDCPQLRDADARNAQMSTCGNGTGNRRHGSRVRGVPSTYAIGAIASA
jgi:hypothetical protein